MLSLWGWANEIGNMEFGGVERACFQAFGGTERLFSKSVTLYPHDLLKK